MADLEEGEITVKPAKNMIIDFCHNPIKTLPFDLGRYLSQSILKFGSDENHMFTMKPWTFSSGKFWKIYILFYCETSWVVVNRGFQNFLWIWHKMLRQDLVQDELWPTQNKLSFNSIVFHFIAKRPEVTNNGRKSFYLYLEAFLLTVLWYPLLDSESWLEVSVKSVKTEKTPYKNYLGKYVCETLRYHIHICLGKRVLSKLFDRLSYSFVMIRIEF